MDWQTVVFRLFKRIPIVNMMRKLVVIALLILVSGCLCCSPPNPDTTTTLSEYTPTTSPPNPHITTTTLVRHSTTTTIFVDDADILTYWNSDYGFQMDYPSTWTVREGYRGTIVLFNSPSDGRDDTFSENVNVNVEDLSNYPGITLEEYYAVGNAKVAENLAGYKLISKENTVMAGSPAIKTVYTTTQDVGTIKVLQEVTLQNQKAYIITYGGTLTGYPKYLPYAQIMINSFMIPE